MLLNSCKFPEIIVVFAIAFGAKVAAMDHKYCDDLAPQSFINLEMLMGVWFGVEYISHARGTFHHQRTQLTDTCFHIDIKEVHAGDSDLSYHQELTPQYEYGPRAGGAGVVPEQRYRHLVLEWEEPGNVQEYHVKLNMSRRGFWLSTTPTYGPYIADMYKNFAGTIQVLKAVSNQLVLSFCQRLPEPKLFTVVLSRQPRQLDQGDLISVHSLLTSKELSTSAVRKVCSGAHSTAPFAVLATLALALISYMLAQET